MSTGLKISIMQILQQSCPLSGPCELTLNGNNWRIAAFPALDDILEGVSRHAQATFSRPIERAAL
jgi:hypothetical protein